MVLRPWLVVMVRVVRAKTNWRSPGFRGSMLRKLPGSWWVGDGKWVMGGMGLMRLMGPMGLMVFSFDFPNGRASCVREFHLLGGSLVLVFGFVGPEGNWSGEANRLRYWR